MSWSQIQSLVDQMRVCDDEEELKIVVRAVTTLFNMDQFKQETKTYVRIITGLLSVGVHIMQLRTILPHIRDYCHAPDDEGDTDISSDKRRLQQILTQTLDYVENTRKTDLKTNLRTVDDYVTKLSNEQKFQTIRTSQANLDFYANSSTIDVQLCHRQLQFAHTKIQDCIDHMEEMKKQSSTSYSIPSEVLAPMFLYGLVDRAAAITGAAISGGISMLSHHFDHKQRAQMLTNATEFKDRLVALRKHFKNYEDELRNRMDNLKSSMAMIEIQQSTIDTNPIGLPMLKTVK